jgi:hypothetical protein
MGFELILGEHPAIFLQQQLLQRQQVQSVRVPSRSKSRALSMARFLSGAVAEAFKPGIVAAAEGALQPFSGCLQ